MCRPLRKHLRHISKQMRLGNPECGEKISGLHAARRFAGILESSTERSLGCSVDLLPILLIMFVVGVALACSEVVNW
jgi:hypothetical protein